MPTERGTESIGSFKPGSLLASGFFAEVFAWDTGRVLKLYAADRARSKVEREHLVTLAAHTAGLPVPTTYELVEVDGRTGIIFERIDGSSMRRHFQARPWKLFSYATQLAALHAQVHGWKAPAQIPPLNQCLKERIQEAVSLSETDKQTARRCLDQLPQGTSLCHGDFHPDNVLLSGCGPIIIDWSGGSLGYPLADVAATSLLFDYAPMPPDLALHLRLLVSLSRRALHSRYLHRYFQLRGGSRRSLEPWRLFLRATRPRQDESERTQLLRRLENLLSASP